MVDATPGLLTTLNTGAYANTGGTGERVLIDYKDAILDYKVADLEVMSYFADPMTTDTGGNIDITFAKPSMKLEQLEEGNTPKYQHTKLRSERVSVKEWGIAVGVTRRMIEDSRFNEVEMALNEARRAVDRHMTKHVVNVMFGVGDSTLETGISSASIDASSLESAIVNFTTTPNGGFFGADATLTGTASRLDDYADQGVAVLSGAKGYVNTNPTVTGAFALSDVVSAITRMSRHGYNATHMFIAPSHYDTLLKMADFTSAFSTTTMTTSAAVGTPLDALGDTLRTGKVVGQLYGLDIVMNAWVPNGRIGIFDLSVKPMAYVERRPLTVEEANPGFGIVGSYMSMRYGLKIVRPEAGQILLNTTS